MRPKNKSFDAPEHIEVLKSLVLTRSKPNATLLATGTAKV